MSRWTNENVPWSRRRRFRAHVTIIVRVQHIINYRKNHDRRNVVLIPCDGCKTHRHAYYYTPRSAHPLTYDPAANVVIPDKRARVYDISADGLLRSSYNSLLTAPFYTNAVVVIDFGSGDVIRIIPVQYCYILRCLLRRDVVCVLTLYR